MSETSGHCLPVSSSDSASFFTRLRHNSLTSASLAGHAAFWRSNSKVSLSVQSGSVFRTRDRLLDALAVALLEAGEDRVRRLDIAGADHVVELELVGLEVGDVARQEITSLAVQEIQVAVEHLLRHLLVDGSAAVVRFLEDAADLAGGGLLGIGGRYRARRAGRSGAVGARAEPDSVSTNTARVARIEAVIHPAVRREGLGIIHDARRFVKGITLWSKARACGSAQQVREPHRSIHSVDKVQACVL